MTLDMSRSVASLFFGRLIGICVVIFLFVWHIDVHGQILFAEQNVQNVLFCKEALTINGNMRHNSCRNAVLHQAAASLCSYATRDVQRGSISVESLCPRSDRERIASLSTLFLRVRARTVTYLIASHILA